MKKIILFAVLHLCGFVFAGDFTASDGYATLEEAEKAVGLANYESERNKDFNRFTMENHNKVVDYLGPAYAGAWTEYGEDGNIYKVIAITKQIKMDASVFPKDYYKFVYVKYSRENLNALKSKLSEIFMRPGHAEFGLVNMLAVDVRGNKVEIVVFPQNKNRVLDILGGLGVDLDMIKVETDEFSHEPAANYHAGTRIVIKRDFTTGFWTCTGGFVGNIGIYHALLTSGHCFPPGGGKVYFRTGSGVAGDFIGDILGAVFGGIYGMDYAVFSNANFAHNISRGILISPSLTIPVRAPIEANDFLLEEKVCSYGGVSGWRCGLVYKVDAEVNLGYTVLYNFVLADFCSKPGDSGGPVIFGNGSNALGIVSTYYSCGAAFGGGGSALRGSAFQPIMPVIRELKGFNLWVN